MKPIEAYEWLKQHSIESNMLASLGSLAGWDQRTNIPIKGHAHRALQFSFLAKCLHHRATDPQVGEMLERVSASDLLSDPENEISVNVREWKRNYDRAVKIPERLAIELAKTTAEGETIWEQSRGKNDWNSFEPILDQIIGLKREEADALRQTDERYDALLDDYEPGVQTAELEVLFADLSEKLPALIHKAKGTKSHGLLLHHRYPIKAQEAFAREITQAIGYDYDSGRLDVSSHPFTVGIGPNDVRITSRYREDFLSSSVFGCLHEAGHGLYEQGLPVEHWGTPRGQACGVGIHESQSRCWENQVGKSQAFWKHFMPLAREVFDCLKEVKLDPFVQAINEVKPGLIRVEADEITYNLHIAIRFELELMLMRNTLQVKDLPEAFDNRMEQLLGVRPTDYKDGVMQDMHWAAGVIGYFPTYTLGNIYAAQLYHTANIQISNLNGHIEKGQFGPLLDWLRTHIHQSGATYLPKELIAKVTGEKPDSKYLIKQLKAKVQDS